MLILSHFLSYFCPSTLFLKRYNSHSFFSISLHLFPSFFSMLVMYALFETAEGTQTAINQICTTRSHLLTLLFSNFDFFLFPNFLLEQQQKQRNKKRQRSQQLHLMCVCAFLSRTIHLIWLLFFWYVCVRCPFLPKK